MKVVYFLKTFIPILAILWLIYAGVFLFIDNRERSFKEKLKADLEKMISDKKEEKMEQETKNKVFDPELLKWKSVLASAPFEKRDSHSVVVFKDKLWLLGGVGGTSPVYKPNYNDIWSSENGEDWTLVLSSAPFAPRRSHLSVVFKNKLWILGGVTNNDRYLNDVWASDDGINWQEVTHSAQWTPRKGSSAVVFQDKIWVMGGIDSNNPKNDVWYSEDGENWILAVKTAPWSPRLGLVTEVFDNKIWLSGGNFPDEMGQKDIWNSEDGITWNFVTNASFPGRHCHCLTSYNGYLWVIGGWSGYAHGYNDVWYSKDGVVWNELYKDYSSPWAGREDLACVDFNNKIFMIGGMKTNGERTNDVWYLSEE